MKKEKIKIVTEIKDGDIILADLSGQGKNTYIVSRKDEDKK